MEDLTLITCSYNTPQVTEYMLRSFFAHHDEERVLACDNSTNEDTAIFLKENCVDFIRNPGGLHIKSVDILLKNVKTKYALLVDTDVIFLRKHDYIFEKFKGGRFTLMGSVCGDRGGKSIHYRVHPWHCFINVEDVKNNNIGFYNEGLQFSGGPKLYDVGCTFFADIRASRLRVGDVNLQGDYFNHYEGMSWRTKRFGDEEGDIDFDKNATHNNKSLYQYGIAVEEQYFRDVEKYKEVSIKCKKS